MTAAFHRRVPECSSPTSLSSGFAPGAGTPNSSASSGSPNSSRVVPSIWVISRPNAVPSWPAGTSSRAASAIEHGPRRGLAGPGPGLGVSRAGRHRGAGPGGQAGQAEDQGEDAVIAKDREQRAGDQAQGRDLGVQRAFLPVLVLRPGRRGDRPVCQQRLRQALPAQVSQPVLVLPQARPGRDPDGQARLRRARVIACCGRDRHEHDKIRGQRGSSDWRAWTRHPPS